MVKDIDINIGLSNKIYLYVEFKDLLNKLKELEETINKMNIEKPIRDSFEVEIGIIINNNKKVEQNKHTLYYEDIYADLVHLTESVFSADFYDIMAIKPIEINSNEAYLALKYQILIDIER